VKNWRKSSANSLRSDAIVTFVDDDNNPMLKLAGYASLESLQSQLE